MVLLHFEMCALFVCVCVCVCVCARAHVCILAGITFMPVLTFMHSDSVYSSKYRIQCLDHDL